jgi:hypothetical protein
MATAPALLKNQCLFVPVTFFLIAKFIVEKSIRISMFIREIAFQSLYITKHILYNFILN